MIHSLQLVALMPFRKIVKCLEEFRGERSLFAVCWKFFASSQKVFCVVFADDGSTESTIHNIYIYMYIIFQEYMYTYIYIYIYINRI